MKAVELFAIVALASCAAMPAFAEKTTIELDTAPGSFSTWKVSDFSATAVRFNATYVRVRTHESWSPSYTLELRDGHGQYVSFTGVYRSGDVPELDTAGTMAGKDAKLGESFLSLKLKETNAVELSWTGKKLRMTSNGATHDYDVSFRPTEIEIICVSGELEVKDITFEH